MSGPDGYPEASGELSMSVQVANGPCSYGAFEITVGIDPHVPAGIDVLDQVARAGYAGIDLGPVGYLGDGAELHDRLAERGLALAGGYVPLPFSDPDALAGQIGYLDAMLDILDSVPKGMPARPTLAASRCWRCASGAAGSTTSTSRTPGGSCWPAS